VSAPGNPLEEIFWEEFFRKFEEKTLAFLYQDEVSGGRQSRFFKLINRGTIEDKAREEEPPSRPSRKEREWKAGGKPVRGKERSFMRKQEKEFLPGHDIIVIGASLGGVEALSKLAGNLPPDLPASIFMVLHVPVYGTSILPDILNRSGPLRAAHAVDLEAIQHGRIYVAPPGFHLLIHHGFVRIVRGPKENGHRPAIDSLFRTAARVYGPRVVGVILTGADDDGAAGLLAIKMCNGVTVVQDPDEAISPQMPCSALEYVEVDYCLPLSGIASLLKRLVHEPLKAERSGPGSDQLEMESKIAEVSMPMVESEERPGKPSIFICPECKGTLWELEDHDLLRFRCRVGHAFTADGLLLEKSNELEVALWSALRALEEKASLARRLALRSRTQNRNLATARFEENAQEAERHAEVIRRVLLDNSVTDREGATSDRLKEAMAGDQSHQGKKDPTNDQPAN